MSGISFLVRIHNEEKTLKQSIESLFKILIPIEINITLHNCTDNSIKIAIQLKKDNPNKNIKIFFYSEEISKAGYENLCTDSDSKHSLTTYYNFCLKKCSLNWIFKWDGDFILSDKLAHYINENILNLKNKKINILAKNEITKNREFYLTDCLSKFTKYIFWEVPFYNKECEEITLDDDMYIEHYLEKSDFVKPYWSRIPWYEKSDDDEAILVKSKMLFLENKFGKEPIGMASASNPICDKYFINITNFFKSKQNFIRFF